MLLKMSKITRQYLKRHSGIESSGYSRLPADEYNGSLGSPEYWIP
jgi:hypothetical protein